MEFPNSKWNIGDFLYLKQDIFYFSKLSEEDKKYRFDKEKKP